MKWMKFIFGIVFVLVVYLVIQVGLKQSITDKENQSTSLSSESSLETKTSKKKQKDPLASYLSHLTLEEKVGQLFFARVPEEHALEDIKTYHLGGYLLFSRDTEGVSPKELTETIKEYQSVSTVPLLIGSDEEGGLVSRLIYGDNLLEKPFLSPQALYQQGGLASIKEDTRLKSQQLKSYGIHTALAPVADVSTNPNAFIYDRTVGLDVEGTKEYVKTVVKEMKQEQLISVLKHFPGYGNNLDSHTQVVHDTRSLKELETHDIPVFQEGIQAGADSLLVAHLIIDALDSQQPASISPKVVDYIRHTLNFSGVIMTDDMDMQGLSQFVSQEEAAYQAIVAGIDWVMSSSYQIQIPTIIAKVKAGDISEQRLDDSVKRILIMKQQAGLLP